MAIAVKPDQWDYLLSPRDGLLDAAIRNFRAAAPTRESLSGVYSLWDAFTSAEFRKGLDECCGDDSGFPFANADPDRLFSNAKSRFASGVAANLLPHALLGTQLVDELQVWLERAALLAAGQRIAFKADLLSIRWSDSQSERLAQLLAAIPEQAGFDAWRLSFHLHHWHNPHELFPTGYLHSLKVPIAAVNRDHSRGFILDLLLGWLPHGQPGLIEHPIVWNLPIERATEKQLSWNQVLESAYATLPFETPVVWGLVSRFDPLSREVGVLGGTSHTAAAHVAFRVLHEKGDYDVGCLLAAELKSDGRTLEGVEGLDKKCEAALLSGINRVVVAKQPTPPKKDISPSVVQKLQSDCGRGFTIHWLATLEKAHEEATGLACGLRLYLTWLTNRMDEEPPAYLGHDRSGSRRLLSTYYIEPDILRTVIQQPGTEGQSATPPPLAVNAATETEEITSFRHRKPDNVRRVAWQREWPKIPSRSRVAIVALPGEGKTLLTLMTVRALANRALCELREQTASAADLTLPIWLRLPDVLTHRSLQRALRHSLREALPGLPAAARKHLERHVKRETTWLFLDAFDEVPEEGRQKLSAILRRSLSFTNESPREGRTHRFPSPCRVILTSRPWAFNPDLLPFDRLIKYQLAPLSPPQRNRFVRRWFANSPHSGREPTIRQLLQRSPSLSEVARNPLLLTLTCSVAEDHVLTPEQVRRVLLYKLAIRNILRGETKPDKAVSDERLEDDLLRLADASWQLLHSNPAAAAFPLSEWYAALVAAGVAKSDRASFTERCRAVGLLIPMGEDKLRNRLWGMPHRSFLEFLAATHVATANVIAHSFEPYMWRADVNGVLTWKAEAEELIVLACGCSPEPGPLLAYLVSLDDERRDALRTMVRLAGRCLVEMDESTIATLDPDLLQRITKGCAESWEVFGHTPEAARTLAHPPGVQWLSSIALSDGHEMRHHAINALAEIGDNKSIQVLQLLADTDDHKVGSESRTARQPSQQQESPADNLVLAQLDRFLQYAHENDYKVSSHCRNVLQQMREYESDDDNEVLAHLDRLRSGTEYDIGWAIDKLIEREAQTEEAVEVLLARLRSESDQNVKNAAIRGLGKLGDTRATSDLLGLFASKNHLSAVIRALLDLRDPRAAPALAEFIVTGQPIINRWMAGFALGEIEEYPGRERLVDALRVISEEMDRFDDSKCEKDECLRLTTTAVALVVGLGRLRSRSEIKLVAKFIVQDLNPTLRWYATLSLAKSNAKNLAAFLCRALREGFPVEWRVRGDRKSMAEALGVLRDETTVEDLVLCLNELSQPEESNKYDQTCAAVINALGCMPSRRVAQVLIAHVGDERDAVRSAAIQCLAHYQSFREWVEPPTNRNCVRGGPTEP